MKKLKEELKYCKKGITLISLVVTIIVLLILAGVTIATLTGDNGILTQANNAKERTEQAEEDELRKLTQGEASTHLEEYEYEDKNGEKVMIPAKCAVSQVEGENTLENGLVIIDANGNEWVWIEVPKSMMPNELTFENETDYTTLETALQTYTNDYKESGYTDIWYDGCGLEEKEYTDLKQKMLRSIYENGGFYVGRYEVGSFDNPVTENNTTRRAVIQEGAYPYNWVTCTQAQELSEELAIGGNTTSLMFGIQWDLVCKYIEVKNVKTKDGTNTIIDNYLISNDSVKWGNYSESDFEVTTENAKKSFDYGATWQKANKGEIKQSSTMTLFTTGASKRNCVLNTYDLAGNVYEWTLEKSEVESTLYCVGRAGYAGNSGTDFPGSSRGYFSVTYNRDGMAFRPSMF